MRYCGSSSSPTAHITFCTLTEVFRPQILIMALPFESSLVMTGVCGIVYLSHLTTNHLLFAM